MNVLGLFHNRNVTGFSLLVNPEHATVSRIRTHNDESIAEYIPDKVENVINDSSNYYFGDCHSCLIVTHTDIKFTTQNTSYAFESLSHSH